jgi:hypothetical protein
MGWVLSRDNLLVGDADAFVAAEGDTGATVTREVAPDPPRSETPRTCRTFLDGSWEIPQLTTADGAEARVWNPQGTSRR